MRINRPRRSGASLVEFAFVVPVLLLLIMGIFEYARLLFAWQLINNAAREGARYAVVSVTKATTAEVQTYVSTYLAGHGAAEFNGFTPANNIKVYKADPATGAETTTAWTECGWGDYVGVKITGSYQPIVPGLLRMTGTITLTAACVMTTEDN